MEFSTREIPFERCSIKAQIWDTAGQERFENMTKAYYRDAVGAMLIYDVSNRNSFDNLKNIWIPQLYTYGHEKMTCIIGKRLSSSTC
jgi:GTPase SAR1 family protein